MPPDPSGAGLVHRGGMTVVAPLSVGAVPRQDESRLHVRWLGRVAYADTQVLQRFWWERGRRNYLILCEHPPTYTAGLRTQPGDLRVPSERLPAPLVRAERGGSVTFHGPGQLVGYPVINVPTRPGATPDHVARVEQLVIDACADLGLPGLERRAGAPGVWLDATGPRPRKLAAVGVRRSRGRTMHGFALNLNCDSSWFEPIVPCGLIEAGVTSLAAEGLDVSMSQAIEAVAARAAPALGMDASEWAGEGDRAGNPLACGRPAVVLGSARDQPVASTVPLTGTAGDEPVAFRARKPDWVKAPLRAAVAYRQTASVMEDLGLVTVCEEAGCPNRSECWSEGTATFMLNGRSCTRACGFCLVDTNKPGPPDPDEPRRAAEAVAALGLRHAVLTAVARDDLADGGAGGFVSAIAAIRARCPGVTVEVLIPDCQGDQAALEAIFGAGPEVLNHNLETVARLQRRVRSRSSYARSLAVLARARRHGLVTKSGLMVGLGEDPEEVEVAMIDLREVGVGILTVGQYLRPSAEHLAVQRWWRPEEFDDLRRRGLELGFTHVEASPLTRSSYHAGRAVAPPGVPSG
ncbi:MAG: lipoyl synthase [Acidimicrobiales bacterium]